MSRTFHDLNTEEKSAFRIWEARYRGDMSTPEEKDEAKRQMETLLWAGPSAIVHELKAEVKALSLRVAALEAGQTIPTDEPVLKPFPPPRGTLGAAQTEEPKKADGRGRPPRRFASERSVSGWQIIDRHTFTLADGPFKTKKDCEARAKELEELVKADEWPTFCLNERIQDDGFADQVDEGYDIDDGEPIDDGEGLAVSYKDSPPSDNGEGIPF